MNEYRKPVTSLGVSWAQATTRPTSSEGVSWAQATNRPTSSEGVSWAQATNRPTSAEGVSWFGVSWLQLQAAVVTAALLMALLVLGTENAGAGEGCSTLGNNAFSTADVADRIEADLLHAQGVSGAGIDVAVIDTGVNASVDIPAHRLVDGPDLSFDSGSMNLRNRDLHGHGTNMAGIIAGENGVAPGARIVNVKVGAGNGAVDVSQVIAAIDWVVANRNADGMNIRVLSLSYDTNSTQSYLVDPLSFAVENAWRHGIVVVVSAGNDGRWAYSLGNPATNPYVIAVASVGYANRVSGFSAKGTRDRMPDLAAPGRRVASTLVPGSFLATNYPNAIRYNEDCQAVFRGSGTSQSAAAVAGAAALLLQDRPSLSPDEVKALMVSTTSYVRANPRRVGSGLLDVAAAADSQVPHSAIQTHTPSTGTGSLELARGTYHVDDLNGEWTAFGTPFNSGEWAQSAASLAAWSGTSWSGVSWSSNGWAGASWSGADWSGLSWSGLSWSGLSWSGVSWSGVSWSGVSWSGVSWSGVSWSGVSWSGVSWSGNSWSSASWS